MSHLTKRYVAVSAAIATALLGAQNYALANYDTFRQFVGANAFSVLLSAGAGVAIYNAALFAYERWLWRLLDSDSLIDGKWRTRLVRSDTPNDVREGEVEIIQSLFSLRFVAGINKGGRDPRTSRWNSVGVVREDGPEGIVWVIYEVRRSRADLGQGEAEIDNGLFRLTPIRDPKTGRVVRLEGQYMDAGRSQRRGQFSATRIG